MTTSKLNYYRFPFKAMGSPCEIQLFAEYQILAQQIAKTAINDVKRLEAKYSRYLANSLLSQINRAAEHGQPVTVDEETAGLIDYADTCYQQSDGLFDISSGKLRQAWQFGSGKIPTQRQLDNVLSKIGWQKIQWRKPVLHFPIKNMELDFGGIVKEYAADRAAELCRQAGARHGVVNLGGDISIIGPRPDNQPWRIGISHPRQTDSEAALVPLSTGALATSGDYQRYMLIDGVRYTHVLNPLTGWPVSHLASVSVVSDFCVIAGSASTIAMLKETNGPAWLEALGLPHLWVDTQNQRGGSINV